MKKTWVISCLLASQALISVAQDTSRANSNLKSATVFFGYGAELTHESKVRVTPSTRQIVINGISTTADPNSLQISVPENVTLLSQQFKLFTPVVPEVQNPRLKIWLDSINMLNKDNSKLNNLKDIEQQTMDKTGALIDITLRTNGNKTITSDETLKLINAYTSKIEKSKTNIFQHNEKIEFNNIRINELQQKVNDSSYIYREAPKTTGQLILQVACKQSNEIPVSFSYFTNNAGFTPLYDVRVNSKTNEIKLIYRAAISQTTGIDWTQTKLTLSTANPSFSGAQPILSPWYLQMYVPQLYNELQYRQGVDIQVNSIPSVAYKKNADRKEEKYYLATDEVKAIDPSNIQQYTTLTENQLNTNFEIDLPYDIKCNGEIQTVTIKEEKLDAVLKSYAVPKLNREAFLLAEIVNWQNLSLLPGIANIIMDDTYLGKSSIDPNITADTMNLSLGRDKRVAVKRVSVKEFTTTKKNGDITKQTFTYEITVKNNKTSNVMMILKDQYPLSQVKEVETNLESSDNAEVNTETGILTWKMELKPGESKKVRFGFTVKYPSDKKISNL